jgi:hypothetical protein
MAESEAKIKVTADGQQAIKEVERVRKGVKGIGDEFAQVGQQFFRTVAGIASLANMLDKAADASRRVREELVAANKERGGSALDREAAGRAMKLTQAQMQAYKGIQETGAVGEQAQVSFMAKLGEVGKKTQGVGGIEYAKAFATGAFTEKELLEMAKKGKTPDIAGRMASLSPDALNEINMRSSELEKTRVDSSAARSQRLAASELERQRRDNPGLTAFTEGVYAIPLVGGAAREAAFDRLQDQYGAKEGVWTEKDQAWLRERSRLAAWAVESIGAGRGREQPVKVEAVNSKPQVGSRENGP